MPKETAATLTEQELFAVFIQIPITIHNTYGALERQRCVGEYIPEDYLREGDGYGGMEDATNALCEYLIADDRPEDALEMLISGLEAYTAQVRKVLVDFHGFKKMHAIASDLPEAEPTNPEERKAWEGVWDEWGSNPRFAAPALTEAVGLEEAMSDQPIDTHNLAGRIMHSLDDLDPGDFEVKRPRIRIAAVS